MGLSTEYLCCCCSLKVHLLSTFLRNEYVLHRVVPDSLSLCPHLQLPPPLSLPLPFCLSLSLKIRGAKVILSKEEGEGEKQASELPVRLQKNINIVNQYYRLGFASQGNG